MRLFSSLIIGISLIIGLYLAGQKVGEGTARFRADNRSLTVKGLAEQPVKSDQAEWRIGFRRAGNDLSEAQSQIAADKKTVMAFLLKQGFKAEEIKQPPTRTIDKLANEYGGQNEEKVRFILMGQLQLTTSNVDLVQSSVENLDALQASGILLDVSQDNGANPRYVLTKFNEELRPQLLANATKNARLTAEQFAGQLDVKIGKLRNANQGVIQIFGANGQDESGGYSASSSMEKKLRVVSTFEFDLK